MIKNIEVDAACALLFDCPAAPGVETVALIDAPGRVVSSDVLAKIPVPPFDRSPYDGYAFRGEDTLGASRASPAVLKITEDIPAGTQSRFEVKPGSAAKILTGAPIPKGADSTIKYEYTEFTDSEVRFFKPIEPGTDIVLAGSDVMPGAVLASKGAVIVSPIVSSLANQGFANVEVFKKPVITVISTGSELCDVGEPLRPAAIYNSNTHTLSAYLGGFGAVPVNGGVVADEPELIAAAIGSALKVSDMVITTGGASVGDYDWAVKSAEILGAEILFWKASLRPGGAMLAAVKDGKVLLSLSGNPAAAVIGLLRVAAPYLKKLCGRSECFFPEVDVELCEPFKKSSPKTRVLRGKLEISGGRAYFRESSSQGSEAVSALVGCDLLGEIPMGSEPLPAGTMIKAYRIDVS